MYNNGEYGYVYDKGKYVMGRENNRMSVTCQQYNL